MPELVGPCDPEEPGPPASLLCALGLQQPVLAAVKALMADGTYKQILDYWGLQSIAISNPTINGAID